MFGDYFTGGSERILGFPVQQILLLQFRQKVQQLCFLRKEPLLPGKGQCFPQLLLQSPERLSHPLEAEDHLSPGLYCRLWFIAVQREG